VGTDQYEDSTVRTVTIYGRNNMTWDDTRKAAAFVTRSDPTVQAVVKSLPAAMAGLESEAVPRGLLTAIAVHQFTLLAGLQYKVDPTSFYVNLSGQLTAPGADLKWDLTNGLSIAGPVQLMKYN
jgi:hypothetical protein